MDAAAASAISLLLTEDDDEYYYYYRCCWSDKDWKALERSRVLGCYRDDFLTVLFGGRTVGDCVDAPLGQWMI